MGCVIVFVKYADIAFYLLGRIIKKLKFLKIKIFSKTETIYLHVLEVYFEISCVLNILSTYLNPKQINFGFYKFSITDYMVEIPFINYQIPF